MGTIVGKQPTVIPEVIIPAKNYDSWWLRDFTMSAPNSKSTLDAIFSLIPYNSTTGETAPALLQKIVIKDLDSESKSDAQISSFLQTLYTMAQKIALSQNKI